VLSLYGIEEDLSNKGKPSCWMFEALNGLLSKYQSIPRLLDLLTEHLFYLMGYFHEFFQNF